jgi:hypothetical protein
VSEHDLISLAAKGGYTLWYAPTVGVASLLKYIY